MKKNYTFFFLFLFIYSTIFSLEPISLYLTLESDPLTSMTIRWITPQEDHNNIVYYKSMNSDSWDVAQGEHFIMPNRQPYVIHYCKLTDLTPSTTYEFKVSEQTFTFNTFSEHLSSLRFIVGGDMYHDDIEYVSKMNTNAALLDPDFIVLGGDLAYSAPKFNFFFSDNITRWLDWLKSCTKTFVTPSGRMIPLVVGIGNHEVVGRYNKTPNEAKYFYSFFRYPNTSSFYNLNFADYFSLFILDSGHTNPISGIQTEWLRKKLQGIDSNAFKFAVYHVPAFPSVRNFNQEVSKLIRKNWVPLFEKHGFKAAFEHHDHAYKRTYPLINYKIDPEGVIYLGDGAWGVKNPRSPKSKKNNPYLAKIASKQHFIQITLTNEFQKYEAIDNNKEVFDTFLRLNKF